MKIANRNISIEHPTFVIAEIGVNHDGSVERAITLVKDAAVAGADAVKLQMFKAERLMHRTAAFADYQRSRVDAADPIAMLKQYELSDAALGEIAAECRRQNIALIATPFSPNDVPAVGQTADAIKIASPDLINRALLSRAIETGLPMIVSTGAASTNEIADAMTWLDENGADYAMLHCVSSYPTPAIDAQLSWIGQIARDGVLVGYSDHTTEPIAGALAVAAGACIIEKHLTYDTKAAGPDHSASFDAEQLTRYVAMIRLADQMRGSGKRRVLECEKDVRKVSRQSLVLVSDVRPGELISRDHLTTQRPGTGISAVEWERVIGRAARRPLRAGEMLDPAAIEGWTDAA